MLWIVRLGVLGSVVWLGTTGAWAQEAAVPPAAAPSEPAAATEPAPPAAPDLSGTWSGSWVSYCNGHRGPMSATFCRIDATRYQVHFSGRFFRIIPFNYTAVLTVTGVDQHGRALLSGSHRLGPVFGTFSFNAWADGTQFVAGYCSEKDQGQFVMTRCGR